MFDDIAKAKEAALNCLDAMAWGPNGLILAWRAGIDADINAFDARAASVYDKLVQRSCDLAKALTPAVVDAIRQARANDGLSLQISLFDGLPPTNTYHAAVSRAVSPFFRALFCDDSTLPAWAMTYIGRPRPRKGPAAEHLRRYYGGLVDRLGELRLAETERIKTEIENEAALAIAAGRKSEPGSPARGGEPPTTGMAVLDAVSPAGKFGESLSGTADGFYSSKALSAKHGVPYGALDANLRRWRNKHLDEENFGWMRREQEGRKMPKVLYAEGVVMPIIESLSGRQNRRATVGEK